MVRTLLIVYAFCTLCLYKWLFCCPVVLFVVYKVLVIDSECDAYKNVCSCTLKAWITRTIRCIILEKWLCNVLFPGATSVNNGAS